MTARSNKIDGKWLELKGDVQRTWGKLTNDDLEKTKGDMKAIGGLIQQKYGQAQSNYGKRLSDIFDKFEDKSDEVVSSVKKELKK